MYQRLINPSKTLSFFLFGARGTGKSQFLKTFFLDHETVYIDLLNPEVVNSLSAYPMRLLDLINPHANSKKWIVIDEIQKIPALLDIVHSEISKKRFKFALTGSSARKLKRGAANLLAGRAFVYNLFPLTQKELAKDFNLIEVLSFGTLPELYHLEDINDKRKYLRTYAEIYLKEEIIAEQIVRNLPPFRRFLEIMALHTTEIINYTNIAKDIDSDPKTVQRYYDILEDTLLGFYLPSYGTSIRKQQKKAKKFYFFDTGITRVLANRIDSELVSKTFEFGQLFENFIINEIYRILSYKDKQFKLSFLRVNENQEIDLIIEKGSSQIILCEIKSTDKIDQRHSKNLEVLGADFKNSKKLLISCDRQQKQFGETLACHWEEAISIIES